VADEMKPVKITWKSDEQWLYDFVNEHSSPSAWFKDLAIAEYKRQNNNGIPKQNSNGMFDLLD
jgi:hypothetical protein